MIILILYYIIKSLTKEGEQMNTIDVGKFIASQRKKLSLTQKELADKLNVTDKAVSKWETGKCYPDVEIIETLSGIFNVGINEILSGKIIESENQVVEAEKNIIDVMKTSKKNQSKWKIIALILSIITVLITVFFIFFNVKKGIKEHQPLTSTEAIFDSKKSMRISIPEVGLKSVLVRQLEDNVNLTDNGFGTVHLLADNRYDINSSVADYYLVISINGKIVARDLSVLEDQASLGATFCCVDIDGDKDKEIILQECIGLSGGAGQYLSRVFDFKNDEIIEVFSSKDKNEVFNTGFSCSVLKNRSLEIKNKYTDYCKNIILPDRTDDYYSVWYENNGEPKNLELMLDTFYKFEPYDIDNDGVYEIKACQYTSLYGHTDFIGTAVSFLKYNKEENLFYICEAFFEEEK